MLPSLPLGANERMFDEVGGGNERTEPLNNSRLRPNWEEERDGAGATSNSMGVTHIILAGLLDFRSCIGVRIKSPYCNLGPFYSLGACVNPGSAR